MPTVGKLDFELVKSASTIRIVKNKDSFIPTLGVESIIAETSPTGLATMLQYSQGFGNVALRQFAKEHIKVSPRPIGLIADGSFAAV